MSLDHHKAASIAALLPLMRKNMKSSSNDRLDQHGDGYVWVEPYSDEPSAGRKWAADYRAKKQNEIKKYDEFKIRLERMQPIDNWYVLYQSCYPIAVSASVYKQQFV